LYFREYYRSQAKPSQANEAKQANVQWRAVAAQPAAAMVAKNKRWERSRRRTTVRRQIHWKTSLRGTRLERTRNRTTPTTTRPTQSSCEERRTPAKDPDDDDFSSS